MGKADNIQLVRRGTDIVEVEACGDCGSTFTIKAFNDKAKTLAKQCCDKKCHRCKKSIKGYAGLCFDCQRIAYEERLENWFQESEKIRWQKYDGPVYCEENEKYYRDVGEFVEDWEDEHTSMDDVLEKPLPSYVWSCDVTTLSIPDVEDMISTAEEDASLNDDYEYQWEGVKELEEAVKAFNDKQTGKVWNPNYKKSVLLEGCTELMG